MKYMIRLAIFATMTSVLPGCVTNNTVSDANEIDYGFASQRWLTTPMLDENQMPVMENGKPKVQVYGSRAIVQESNDWTGNVSGSNDLSIWDPAKELWYYVIDGSRVYTGNQEGIAKHVGKRTGSAIVTGGVNLVVQKELIDKQGEEDRANIRARGNQDRMTLATQNEHERQLQNQLGQQALEQIAARGINANQLQLLQNEGLLERAHVEGWTARDVQTIANLGALDVARENGLNAQAVQDLQNEGLLDVARTEGWNLQQVELLRNTGLLEVARVEGWNAREVQNLANLGYERVAEILGNSQEVAAWYIGEGLAESGDTLNFSQVVDNELNNASSSWSQARQNQDQSSHNVAHGGAGGRAWISCNNFSSPNGQPCRDDGDYYDVDGNRHVVDSPGGSSGDTRG